MTTYLDLKRRVVELIRLQSRGKPKEPCYVCGNWQSIAEIHHLSSVSAIANQYHELIQTLIPDEQAELWNRFAKEHKPYTVFLCPNHHRVIHILAKLDSLKASDETQLLYSDIIRSSPDYHIQETEVSGRLLAVMENCETADRQLMNDIYNDIVSSTGDQA